MQRNPSSPRLFALLLSSVLLAAACNDGELASGTEPTPAPDWSDVYQQGSTGEVDILWVVDNSGSMGDEQGKLAQHFEQFINEFVQLDLDFHIAIVTTDMEDANESGRFQGVPKILTPDTPDLINTFQNNVHVGTNGSGTEMGLEAARTALSEPLISTHNSGFLRDSAHLAVIIVSDEDDGGSEANPPTQDPPAEFVRFLNDLKNGDFSLSAVVGDMPAGCSSATTDAQAGARYYDAVDTGNGLISSICQDDFAPVLTALGEFIGSQVSAKFPASYEAVLDTVRVWVDQVEIEPGDTTWHYDTTLQAVVFAPGAEPAECSEVLISYARVNTEPLTATPGGTGYDPICWETTPPEDPPDPILGGELDGGAINCAVAPRGRPAAAAWVLALAGIVWAWRRRRPLD